MAQVPFECRYNKLIEKNPREIVLLRGSGCKWRRCCFCDYHLDFCLDEKENFKCVYESETLETNGYKIKFTTYENLSVK